MRSRRLLQIQRLPFTTLFQRLPATSLAMHAACGVFPCRINRFRERSRTDVGRKAKLFSLRSNDLANRHFGLFPMLTGRWFPLLHNPFRLAQDVLLWPVHAVKPFFHSPFPPSWECSSHPFRILLRKRPDVIVIGTPTLTKVLNAYVYLNANGFHWPSCLSASCMGRGGPLGGTVTSIQSSWLGLSGNGLCAVSGMKKSVDDASCI